jgi:hypothetical protein
MAHPETMLPISKIEDPVKRFVAVTKFYLSGWHIKPPYAALVLLQDAHKHQLISEQGSKETAQSDPRRDFHRLLGIPRWHEGILPIRADIAPPTEVELFLHGTRTQHSN